jgi:hypothetical protein
VKLASIALALVLVAGSAPALAQSETGTRMGGRPAQLPVRGSNVDRARIWLERYAACIARRDPKRVSTMLDGEVGDDGPMRKLTEGNFDACLSTGGGADGLAFKARLLRGALYADRVTSRAGRIGDVLATASPLVYPASASGPALAQSNLVRFGECVVRANPPAALGFVAAHAASDVERNHLNELRPLLGNCIAAGQRVQLSASVLEGALAEAIYRMDSSRGTS